MAATVLVRYLTRIRILDTSATRRSSSSFTYKKPPIPCKKLNSGHEIPVFGLGTWKSGPGVVQKTVEDAIEVGYRHLDCALVYQNESEVGTGIQTKIKEGTVRREDLFITSKVWNTFHSKEAVSVGLKRSLDSLQVSYLDLYLIHWPFGYQEGDDLFPKDDQGQMILSDVDYTETWKGLEEAVRKGQVKSIGLSNFNSQQINRILDICTIKPAMLQVECHPYLNQSKLIDFCKSNDILVTAYSPLGSADRPWAKPGDPALLDDPKLAQLTKKYGKSPAQIILRWSIQRDTIVIPKTVRKERLIENANIFDFSLTSDDMAYIDSMNCDGRLVRLDWVRNTKFYPFAIEF